MIQEHYKDTMDLEGDNYKNDGNEVKRRRLRKRFVNRHHFTSIVNEKGVHSSNLKKYPKKKHCGETKKTFQGGGLEEKKAIRKFDQQSIRMALSCMIIEDELPFKFVEGKGFRHYMSVTQPSFQIPSMINAAEDCYQMFQDEKEKVCALLKENIGRICLTTDTWTSTSGTNYMRLSAQFIDNDWKLRKKVMNFLPISSHRGVDIGKAIEMCLCEWGIDNVFTITLGDTCANDVAVDYLKSKFVNYPKCVLKAKWVHVQCGVHIMNSIVQDSLNHIAKSVDRVRGVVKYVLQSSSRVDRFKHFAKIEKCQSTEHLVLDDPTNWNTTHRMLETAQHYQRAFYSYICEEQHFRNNLKETGVPNSLDWKKVRKLVLSFKLFNDFNLKVCEPRCVTSHVLVEDIHSILFVLKACLIESDDVDLLDMTALMKNKLDEYYGDVKRFNMLMYVACLLDPRNKFPYLEGLISEVYGSFDKASIMNMVKDNINELYKDYVRIHDPHSTFDTPSSLGKRPTPVYDDPRLSLREKIYMKMRMKMVDHDTRASKSELDKYMGEDVEDESPNFDILTWWKVNSPRFPILSLLARDVLAIPISSVASEWVFHMNGSVLDPFRSSLSFEMVESLVCTQDWLRTSSLPTNIVESCEEELDEDGDRQR